MCLAEGLHRHPCIFLTRELLGAKRPTGHPHHETYQVVWSGVVWHRMVWSVIIAAPLPPSWPSSGQCHHHSPIASVMAAVRSMPPSQPRCLHHGRRQVNATITAPLPPSWPRSPVVPIMAVVRSTPPSQPRCLRHGRRQVYRRSCVTGSSCPIATSFL